MGAAAVAVGKAIGYQNAGTVEFILGPDGSFYFLEVNTRLQVEHPVTEGVTGLDLVAEQLRVAEGHPLSFTQDELVMQGAALEARVYAEDPAGGFLPQSGKLVDWHVPDLEGLRVDGGVESGDEVGIHYDPMLAKVITTGRDREEARRRMVRALRALSVQGFATNRDFLVTVLEHPKYVEGDLHTHFIDEHLQDSLASAPSATDVTFALLAATFAAHEARRANAPLALPSGFRLHRYGPEVVEHATRFGGVEQVLRVEYTPRREPGTFDARVGHGEHVVRVLGFDGTTIRLDVDGHRVPARVVREGDVAYVHVRGANLALEERPRFPERVVEVPRGGCIAPMPGKVVKVLVEEGALVDEGQTLLVMEAMKMEHAVKAPQAGRVTRVNVVEGEQVDADALLALVESAESE